jgi:hypothetical protein
VRISKVQIIHWGEILDTTFCSFIDNIFRLSVSIFQDDLAWILLLGFHVISQAVQGDLFGVMSQVYGISEWNYDRVLP